MGKRLNQFTLLFQHHVMDGPNLSPNGDEEKNHCAEQGIGFCDAKHEIISPAEKSGDKAKDTCKAHKNTNDVKCFGEFHIKRVKKLESSNIEWHHHARFRMFGNMTMEHPVAWIIHDH